MHQATTAGCGLALRLRLRTRESLFECENGNHNMKFSLRTLLLTMLLGERQAEAYLPRGRFGMMSIS